MSDNCIHTGKTGSRESLVGLASLSRGLVHQLPLLVSVNDYFSLLGGGGAGVGNLSLTTWSPSGLCLTVVLQLRQDNWDPPHRCLDPQ